MSGIEFSEPPEEFDCQKWEKDALLRLISTTAIPSHLLERGNDMTDRPENGTPEDALEPEVVQEELDFNQVILGTVIRDLGALGMNPTEVKHGVGENGTFHVRVYLSTAEEVDRLYEVMEYFNPEMKKHVRKKGRYWQVAIYAKFQDMKVPFVLKAERTKKKKVS